jgi:hypothetical protein
MNPPMKQKPTSTSRKAQRPNIGSGPGLVPSASTTLRRKQILPTVAPLMLWSTTPLRNPKKRVTSTASFAAPACHRNTRLPSFTQIALLVALLSALHAFTCTPE